MGLPLPNADFAPWFINDFLDETYLVIGETTFDGSIKERVLSDGTALITLHLEVKNAPLTVFDWGDLMGWLFGDLTERPSAVLGAWEDGYMDYTVLYKFIIPAPGDPLPHVFASFDNYIYMDITGTGFGILTERAVELGFAENAGALGRVRLHQISLFKPDLKDEHPKYDPSYGDLWPVETIEIHEIG
ncbi:MAG: hypothetical protein ACXABG_11570 [Promethearchaeota archaeon]|jgi:hypothetical protein